MGLVTPQCAYEISLDTELVHPALHLHRNKELGLVDELVVNTAVDLPSLLDKLKVVRVRVDGRDAVCRIRHDEHVGFNGEAVVDGRGARLRGLEMSRALFGTLTIGSHASDVVRPYDPGLHATGWPS